MDIFAIIAAVTSIGSLTVALAELVLQVWRLRSERKKRPPGK